ncbi:lipoyl(octanoyl) transferase LipB [Alphaproteobacteria bacterium]|nr:lipoyl(octanoyl) transferase LipB [Alphaproteobacteria bacterium]
MNIEIKKQYNFVDYEKSVEFMKSRVSDIITDSKEELIWFLNHDHIYTQGTSASNNEILKKNKIQIVKTNRGGKTTYHGPGQRIIYFIINLNKRKKDIRQFISIIESSLMEFLKIYNIDCATYKNRVGIWVTGKDGKKFNKEEKIGAIGLRLKNWITYHGLSFNINPDMKNYDYINACGLGNYNNTSLKELGIKINEDRFDEEFSQIFLKNINNFK